MPATRVILTLTLAVVLRLAAVARAGDDVSIDLSNHDPRQGVTVRRDGSQLRLVWPMADKEYGVLSLRFRGQEPLIEELGTARSADGANRPHPPGPESGHVSDRREPATFPPKGGTSFSTTRRGGPTKRSPPPWPSSPCRSAPGREDRRRDRRTDRGPVPRPPALHCLPRLPARPRRGRGPHRQGRPRHPLRRRPDPARPRIGSPSGGSTRTTSRRAGDGLADRGRPRRLPASGDRRRGRPAGPSPSSRRRTSSSTRSTSPTTSSSSGTAAAISKSGDDRGFGVRQTPEGDGRFVPWVNAPPGTEQRLGVFYLLSRGDGRRGASTRSAGSRTATASSRCRAQTFTSHYHIEHTLRLPRRQRQQKTDRSPAALDEPPLRDDVQGPRRRHRPPRRVPRHGHTPEMNARAAGRCSRRCTPSAGGCRDDRLPAPARRGAERPPRAGTGSTSSPGRLLGAAPGRRVAVRARRRAAAAPSTAVRNAADVLRLMETRARPDVDRPPADQGVVLLPGPLPRRATSSAPTASSGAAWKAMPADFSQPTARDAGARPARRHGELGRAQVRARRGRRVQGGAHARAVRPHERQLPEARRACRGSTTAGSRCSTPSGAVGSS